MVDTNEQRGIKIYSVQASNIYCVNNNIKLYGGKEPFLNLKKAVLQESLFSDYMKHHGVRINRKNRTLDFVSIEFDDRVVIFDEEDNKKVVKSIKASTLRKEYYDNGIEIVWKTFNKNGEEILAKRETIHYVMLMRSPGKAKKGSCIFIRKELYAKAINYLSMDLIDKLPNRNAKIVEMSAYQTLTTATAIDYIKIPWENILVIEDEDVVAENIKTVSVKTRKVPYTAININYEETEKIINELGYTFYPDKTKRENLKHIKRSKLGLLENEITEYVTTETKKEKSICYVDRNNENSVVKNTLWDGMGIIDDSIFPENMEGFIYCRNHFFKACLFRGSVQNYFKDYYKEKYDTATVKDMFGNVLKVKDIKVITTNNAIKWLKFIDLMGDTEVEAYKYYKKVIEKYDCKFAIVKSAHKSKYGELQRSSYQINNSLPCIDKEKLFNIAKPSIDYVNDLKINHDKYIEYLKISNQKYKINDVIIALDEWNDKFKYTQYYKEKRNSIISEFKKERLQLGKLLQYGDNLTICGNPVAMLMKVTGQNILKEDCFNVKSNCVECYTTKFANGECLAGFRSPHNSPNNIVHLCNTYPDILIKYFGNLGNNVIVVNGIGTDIQQRLNGMDEDSDYVFVTNQKDIVQLAEQSYVHYPTIINDIELVKSSMYGNDNLSYAKMDNKIKSAQSAIGNSSNLAQLALSYYYDGECKNEELEDVFIICSVLAQCAIDSAKRSYDIKITQEIERLKKLECMLPEDGKIYPEFFANILKMKDKKIEDELVREYNCPMDQLATILQENVIDKRGKNQYKELTYHLSTVFEYKKGTDKESKQRKKVISIVEEYDDMVKKLDKKQEEYHEMVSNAFDECMDKIKNIKLKPSTMSFLILYAFSPNGSVKDRLLVALYNHDKETFLNCFKKSLKSSHRDEKTSIKIA